MKILFVSILLLMFAATAWAQQPKEGLSTGAEFLATCADSPEAQPTIELGLCVAYIRGYMDAMMTTEKVLRSILGQDFRWTVCLPEDTQPLIVLQTVRTWLQRHPEALKQSIAPIITAALHDSFPCSIG